MSYEDKLTRARAIIDEFNAQSDKDGQINPDKFEKSLKAAGGVNEQLLQECTWEELQKCGLPVLLARKVASIFREAQSAHDATNAYISEKKAQKMAPRYLIEAYDPKEKNSAVHKRLAELSRGKKFLVFKTDGKVDAVVSEKLLREVQDGFPERETYTDTEGQPLPVRAVGVDPKKTMVDENPLYAGRPLRPDGTCDQINRSWTGVPQAIRQTLYLAVTKTGEVKLTHDKAHDLLDLALQNDEKKIKTRFPKAVVLLKELTDSGTAPTLKIALNNEDVTARSNNPFGQHRTY
jgi:hypothetical protein